MNKILLTITDPEVIKILQEKGQEYINKINKTKHYTTKKIPFSKVVEKIIKGEL